MFERLARPTLSRAIRRAHHSDDETRSGGIVCLALTDRGNLVIRMTMSEISSIAETKAHLSELIARVGEQHERVTVTVHGRPAAVLTAVDDLQSLEETIAVLADSAAVRALGDADAELARREGETTDD